MAEALTSKRIADFSCPIGKQSAYCRDSNVTGLGIKASVGGSKRFILEARLASGSNIRLTIGDVKTWALSDARTEARRLLSIIDQGRDPRQERAEKSAADAAARAQAKQHNAPALEAWGLYIENRSADWSKSYRADHAKVATEGGKIRTRGKRPGESDKTKPGILRALLSRPLNEITPHRVKNWLAIETKKRPTHARVAFGILRAFLNWAAEQEEFSGVARTDACTSKDVKRNLPAKNAKTDCLEREQLALWFAEVKKLPNPQLAAFLQILLLCGPRRNELAALKWADVDMKWRSLTLHDKVEGMRVISMTPYVHLLLSGLQAINNTPPPETRILNGKRIANDLKNWKPSQWVFSSNTSASGHIEDAGSSLERANLAAGLPNVTQHGLRRSFKTLSEWVEVPTGIVAQIMGHKPSATAEKHYTVRPLDLLRMWHTRIEAWMLDEAGIAQPEGIKRPERILKAV